MRFDESTCMSGKSLRAMLPAKEMRAIKRFLNTFNVRVWNKSYTEVDRSDPEGAWTIYIPQTGASEGSFPAKITGGGPVTYTADFHRDGKNEDATGSGSIEVLSLNLSETLPVGTWVIATLAAVSVEELEEEE